MHRAFVTALGAEEDLKGDCRQITGKEDELFSWPLMVLPSNVKNIITPQSLVWHLQPQPS